jgi:hypothetical protein
MEVAVAVGMEVISLPVVLEQQTKDMEEEPGQL